MFSHRRIHQAFRRIAWRLAIVGFIAVPIFWASGYALLYSLGGVGRLSRGWTLEHWRRALGETQVLGSLTYSLTISAVVTALVTLLSIGSLVAAPRIRNQPTFLLMVVLLMGTPALVLAQMIAHMLGSGGWLSRIGFRFGLIGSANEFPNLVNDSWSVGMIVAMVLSLLPLAWLYFSQLWNTVRLDRQCELAESLGATLFEARRSIALPVLVRRGRSMILLLFILAMGSYEVPLLLGKQTPQMFSVMTQRMATGFDLETKPQAFVLATLYLTCMSLTLACYIRGRRSYVGAKG